MSSVDFSTASDRYEKSSLVQRAAGDHLFDLVGIRPTDDVLDLGCGPGHLSARIRQMTQGRIVGVDMAAGMLSQAERNYGAADISFELCDIADMAYSDAFDVIFCNSTFQWFNPPQPVLEACHRALKTGGRMGIQAPARHAFCPNFVAAIDAVKSDARTRETFAHFRDPWLFFDDVSQYESLFKSIGFQVEHARIDKVDSAHTPEDVFGIFDTGAAAGYLNQQYYTAPIDEAYVRDFRDIVSQSFKAQADEAGMVNLTFFRVYLLAMKTESSETKIC